MVTMNLAQGCAMRFLTALALVLPLAAAVSPAHAQSFRRGAQEFNAVRTISIPPGKFTIGVFDFMHHGEVNSTGSNVVVYNRGGQAVPMRVLQIGPGDLCRVAFQLTPGVGSYDVCYGGPAIASGLVPPFDPKEGLLMETRDYPGDTDLRSFESVKKAFDSAKPYGGDFVEGVLHSFNPFFFQPEPFLTRYSGYLHLAQPGTYGFMTSSQDASFVLVDGKVVTSAPGRHKPLKAAQPGIRADVKLGAGVHKFEYYHAAAGSEATMICAWEVNPTGEKVEKPAPIPATVLMTQAVGRAVNENLATKSLRMSPDFLYKIEGEVPLPDNDLVLVGVSFKDTSSRGLTMKSKIEWSFGDGLTSEEPNPVHVYLRPGAYIVKLAIKRSPRDLEISNRVVVDRPPVTKHDKEYTLDDYLPIVTKYDPRKASSSALVQLAYLYEAKAAELEAGPEQKSTEELHQLALEGKSTETKVPSREETERKRVEALKYLTMAVGVAKGVFLESSAAVGDEDLMKFARLVIPMSRDRLGDSPLALQLWMGAAKKMTIPADKAECLIEAADVAINDLVKPQDAKGLLETASHSIASARTKDLKLFFSRVMGDYYAATGDGKAARKSYREAEGNDGSVKNFIERSAWRGAHNRSTEDYLKAQQYDRAAAEIRRWERTFPGEKTDGMLTFMYARYWAGRKKHDQAMALAEQLLVVNPDSPYIDQMLILASDCALEVGNKARALAMLQSLVKDYPGSPLVPKVKERITKIEAGLPLTDKKGPRKRDAGKAP